MKWNEQTKAWKGLMLREKGVMVVLITQGTDSKFAMKSPKSEEEAAAVTPSNSMAWGIKVLLILLLFLRHGWLNFSLGQQLHWTPATISNDDDDSNIDLIPSFFLLMLEEGRVEKLSFCNLNSIWASFQSHFSFTTFSIYLYIFFEKNREAKKVSWRFTKKISTKQPKKIKGTKM